jgi:hypothetical protein
MSFCLARQAAIAGTLVATGCGRLHFDATASEDGGAGDGALAPGACNGVDRIADDFEGGLATDIWASSIDPGTSFDQTGGEIVLTLAPNTTNTFVSYVTNYLYDLRNHRMYAELDQAPNTGAAAGLEAEYDPQQYLHVDVLNGFVVASWSIAGTFSMLKQIPYAAGTHRFLALEERDGQLSFETSPDGVTFTTFYQDADPFDLSLVRARLYAGTTPSVANPGVASFGSVNGTPTGLGSCPVSTLVDHFDDGESGHLWENSFMNACCSEAVTGGVLTMSTDGTVGKAAQRSSAAYNLTGDHIAVAVPMAPGGASRAGFLLWRANNDALVFEVRATTLGVTQTIGGTTTNLVSVPRDPSVRYMQIRESGGMVYLESSADRVTWQQTYSAPPPFPIDNIGISIQGGILGAPSTADSLSFDDLGP